MVAANFRLHMAQSLIVYNVLLSLCAQFLYPCSTNRPSSNISKTALDSAEEEKKSFSKAVETLKANTTKVQDNYKQMKQELAARNIRITDLEREKGELISQVETTVVETAQLQQGAAVPSSEMEALREEHQVLKEHLNALRHNIEVSLIRKSF